MDVRVLIPSRGIRLAPASSFSGPRHQMLVALFARSAFRVTLQLRVLVWYRFLCSHLPSTHAVSRLRCTAARL